MDLHVSEKSKRTPVMQQYVDFKAENPDALLMFRLGDFFESFFLDESFFFDASFFKELLKVASVNNASFFSKVSTLLCKTSISGVIPSF